MKKLLSELNQEIAILEGKASQRQHLVELMKEDEKNGMYDITGSKGSNR